MSVISPLLTTLTHREVDILRLLMKGLSDQEIATQLVMSVTTIKWYNRQIYSKLSVRGRRQAAVHAQQLGLDAPMTAEVSSARQHNLPSPLSTFIGREEETTQLLAMLKSPSARLINIHGLGGMGKTRLAIRAAELALHTFAHGICFIPLAGYDPSQDLLRVIADKLNLYLYGSEDVRARVLHFLHGKQMLLLLDNFEPFWEQAPLIADLLRDTPQVTALVTSREHLHVYGEMVFTLDGLPPAASGAELFIQRAASSRPDFALNDEGLLIIRQICQFVGGMPLAIELAAHWVNSLTLAEIANALTRDLDLLQHDLLDVPARQQKIRTVLEETWNRLESAERNTMMQLAVFRGGWTRAAAESVCAASLDVLSRLSRKALIAFDATVGRYDMHELVRQFALSEAESTHLLDALKRAHMTYFVGNLQAREQELAGDGRDTARDIASEFANMQAAWRAACQLGDAAAIEVMMPVLDIWSELANRIDEYRLLLQEALTAFDLLAPLRSKIEVRWINQTFTSNAVTQLPPIDAAFAKVQSALDAARIMGNDWEAAYCAFVLGVLAYNQCDAENVTHFYRLSAKGFEQVGDRYWQTSSQLIMVCGLAGSHHPAALAEMIETCDLALDAAHQTRNSRIISWAETYMGWLAWMMDNDLAQSLHWFHESILHAKEIGAQDGWIGPQGWINFLIFCQGNFADAEREAEICLKESIAINDTPNGIGKSYALIGMLANLAGQYEEGLRLGLEAARDMVTAVNILPWAYWCMSVAQCGLRDYAAANATINSILSRNNNQRMTWVALFCPSMAVISAAEGGFEQSARLLGFATTYLKEAAGWLKHWQLIQTIQTEARTQLGDARYAAAWQDGAGATLATIAAELLTDSATNELS